MQGKGATKIGCNNPNAALLNQWLTTNGTLTCAALDFTETR
jgi:hypothetical protein